MSSRRRYTRILWLYSLTVLVLFVWQFNKDSSISSHKTSEAPKPIEIPPECACKSNKTGEIHDFCYRFPENPKRKGKKFSCEWVEKWEEIESKEKLDLTTDPVFLTAFNQPFFHNGKRLISSIRRQGFHNKVVIYDLGIDPEKLKTFEKAACNVEIRKFNFSAYPNYVKHLREYRWKPIAMAETLRDYGAVWYLDSSLIITKPNLSHIEELFKCQNTGSSPMLSDAQRDSREARSSVITGWDKGVWERNRKECRKSNFLFHGYSGHGIWSTTNPGVYSYFPINEEKLKKRKAKMFDSGLIYTVNTKEVMQGVLKWSFLCSLEKDCMAPEGHRRSCIFKTDRFTEYAGCHRYDQSVMNVLLANRF